MEIMEEILGLYQELRSLVGENSLGLEFCQQIHRIFQETIDHIPEGTRLVIRPAGAATRKLLELYDFSEKNIIGIVSPSDHGNNFCGYPCFTMDSFSYRSCDCVIISSFHHHQEIKEELKTHNIPYIDFYDALEKRGIRLCVPHHFYELCPQLIVNYFYLRYLWSEAGPQREIALNELLQIAVECMDFPLISNIYQECGGENGEFPLLKAVWGKSKQLLDCIQNKLSERKQKDIIWFWTDSVPYNMLHCLPETAKLSQQGTFFQRAHTHTPYTASTMLSTFCNILPIDNFPQNQEKIDSKNSPLIQFLENMGYKVRVIGDLGLSIGKEHLLEVSEFLSCNMKWWEGIIDLLQSPEPCFYLFQFMESHPPSFVPNLKEAVDLFKANRTQQKVQFETALGYLDQCLLLYHKLLGDKTQIFFSDHGQPLWGSPWTDQQLHPYCFVVGENIPKKTVTRFFPYKNFEKFVQWLVDPVHFSMDDVCADEVIFQDIDFGNPAMIDRFIKEGRIRNGIAYRGILNYDYKYVINPLGEEFFYQIHQDGSEELVPLKDLALRDELRSKSGTVFLDINRYDEFRYVRKLYDLIKLQEVQ